MAVQKKYLLPLTLLPQPCLSPTPFLPQASHLLQHNPLTRPVTHLTASRSPNGGRPSLVPRGLSAAKANTIKHRNSSISQTVLVFSRDITKMDSHSANLAVSPSHTSTTLCFPGRRSGSWTVERRPRLHDVRAARDRPAKADRPLRKESKRLSHILRTEAAVLAVERKAVSTAPRQRLWPKAVLEALDDAVANNKWESALKIFGLLRKQHWYNPKSQTYARLLTMLGKCGQPEHASSLFQIMLSEGLMPTIDVYTSLLGAYGYSGLLAEAFQTIDEMKSISDCKPDVYTYTILINCCSKLRRFDLISKVLSEMSYLGIEGTIVTYNTIIDGYGKAGLFKEMENSVSDMLESGNHLPDVFTLNSIIWAYGNSGHIDKMEKWFDEFQHMGIEPDVKTFNILIKSYGKAGMNEKMSLVMDFMKKRSFTPTIVTYNILIESYGKAGNIDQMEYLFRSMKFQGMRPNSVTYCSLINAYSKAGLVEKISVTLRQIENSNVDLDTPFFNCVISAYGQSGNVGTMEEIFLLMKERKCKPDVITLATMIQAYTSIGMTEAAQNLETEMQKMKRTPIMCHSRTLT